MITTKHFALQASKSNVSTCPPIITWDLLRTKDLALTQWKSAWESIQ